MSKSRTSTKNQSGAQPVAQPSPAQPVQFPLAPPPSIDLAAVSEEAHAALATIASSVNLLPALPPGDRKLAEQRLRNYPPSFLAAFIAVAARHAGVLMGQPFDVAAARAILSYVETFEFIVQALEALARSIRDDIDQRYGELVDTAMGVFGAMRRGRRTPNGRLLEADIQQLIAQKRAVSPARAVGAFAFAVVAAGGCTASGTAAGTAGDAEGPPAVGVNGRTATVQCRGTIRWTTPARSRRIERPAPIANAAPTTKLSDTATASSSRFEPRRGSDRRTRCVRTTGDDVETAGRSAPSSPGGSPPARVGGVAPAGAGAARAASCPRRTFTVAPASEAIVLAVASSPSPGSSVPTASRAYRSTDETEKRAVHGWAVRSTSLPLAERVVLDRAA